MPVPVPSLTTLSSKPLGANSASAVTSSAPTSDLISILQGLVVPVQVVLAACSTVQPARWLFRSSTASNSGSSPAKYSAMQLAPPAEVQLEIDPEPGGVEMTEEADWADFAVAGYRHGDTKSAPAPNT